MDGLYDGLSCVSLNYLLSLYIFTKPLNHNLSHLIHPKCDENLGVNIQQQRINMQPYDGRHTLFPPSSVYFLNYNG